MTSPTYTDYASIKFLPNKGPAAPSDDEGDVILHGFVDDLEVVIHPQPAKVAFPDPKPPTPPKVGPIDPNVDYNRVLLPMKPGHLNEFAQRSPSGSMRAGVEYTSGSDRERFRVETGSVMKRNGMEFDTAQIKLPYLQGDISFQALEHATGDQITVWAETSLIWVCIVPKGQQSVAFYSHVCRGGEFHHSSLTAGGSVVGAGEWVVKDGKLRRISANSGHYQPTIDFLYRSVLHLADARHPDTSVFLYDSHNQAWVDRPWSDFIRSPTDNGRYWTHPNAALASA